MLLKISEDFNFVFNTLTNLDIRKTDLQQYFLLSILRLALSIPRLFLYTPVVLILDGISEHVAYA